MTIPNADSPHDGALFEAAHKLRGSVESAEYKHLVLGLIFLKYISDAFEQRRRQLEAELSTSAGTATSRTRKAGRRSSRTVTNTPRRTSSGCLRRPAGRRYWRPRRSLTSPEGSTRHWERSSARNSGLRNVLPRTDAERQERLFEQLAAATVTRWQHMAEERLPDLRASCFVMPGNDDVWWIDAAFDGGRRVRNCYQQVVELGDGYSLLSLAYANRTPWDSPRELDEEELGEIIDCLGRARPRSGPGHFQSPRAALRLGSRRRARTRRPPPPRVQGRQSRYLSQSVRRPSARRSSGTSRCSGSMGTSTSRRR